MQPPLASDDTAETPRPDPPARGGRLWRIVRVGVAVAAALVVVFVALITGVVAALQTEWGRDVVTRLIVPIVADATGLTVHIEGLAPGVPVRLAFDRLSVADAEGTWLEIDRFDLHWRPVALLTGTLAISNLSADRLSLARLPAATEPELTEGESEPFSLPSLPIDVRLDRLSVGSLALAAPVIGEPAVFSVSGRLGAAAGEAIESDLHLRRLDGGSLQAEALARLAPATSRFQLDLRLEDGADGFIAKLAGIEGAPPIRLALVGDGPLDAWDGRFDLTLADLAAVDADLRLRGEGGRRIQLDGRARWQGESPDAVPEIIRPAVADGLDFAADVDLRAGGAIEVESASLKGRDFSLAASGEVVPNDDRLDLTVDALVGEGALASEAMEGFRLRSAVARVTATGSLAAPEVRGGGTVEGVRGPDLRVGEVEWTASARPPPAADGQELHFTATAKDVDPPDARLRAVIGPKAEFVTSAVLNSQQSLLRVQELTLQLAAARLEGKGDVALGDGTSTLDLRVAVDDLSRLSSLAGMPLVGQGRISAAVTGPLVQGRLSTTVEAALSDFATQEALIQAALGPKPIATADVRFDQASGLEVARLRITGRAVDASGTGALYDHFAGLRADLEAEVADLAPLARAAGTDAAGRLRMTAKASGSVADPVASVIVQLADARIADVSVPHGRVEVTAKALGSRPAGELRASAETSMGPVEIAGAFAQPSSETLDVRDLQANLLGVRTEGHLAVGLATGLVSGRLVGGLPALGVPLAQPLLRGDASFEVTLRPDRQAQTVDLRLHGASLRLAGDEGDAASISSLRLDAHVADALGRPRIDADARISGMQFADEGPFAATLDANGPLNELALALDLTGPKNRLSTATIHGRVNAAGDVVRVDIAQLTAQVGAYRLALHRPMAVIAGSGRLTVNDLDLAIGEGNLRGRLELRPGTTLLTLDARSVPIGIAKPWIAGLPAGQVSLQADARGTNGEVTGPFSMQVDSLRLDKGTLGQAAMGRAAVRGRLGEGALDASGDVAIDDGMTATFSGRLPMMIRAGELAPQLGGGAGLVAQATLNADLARVTGAIGFADQRLAGSVAADVRVGGSVDRPEVTGSVVLKDGLYENFVTGTLLTSINGRLDAAAGELLTVTLTAATKGSGMIVVDGRAALAAQDGPAIELAVTAKQARLVHRDDVMATTDASLRYQGGLSHGRLTGTVEPTAIEVRLLDRLPPNVVVLPVTEINRPGGDHSGEERQSGAAWIADLDIDVDIPRRVFVRGRGLESEWSGRLHVGGTATVPQLTGSIEVVRGVFTFASKRFDLQKGTITFTGGQPIDPVLDIAATYRTPDLTAVIGVVGTASDPKLGVTSQPPLPESEVLAQVLFGKSTARLGPVEAVQLASAIDSLARGESWSEDVLGSVRQFLGLDVLSVDTTNATGDQNGTGGASVEAGRYVTEGVYVGAKQGVTDSSTSGKVEVEIIPGLSLQSDLTQNAEGMTGSIGLRWRHDY